VQTSCKGEKRNAYSVLVGKLDGKRPFERSRNRWDNIINVREIGWMGMHWIHLAQNRDHWIINKVMNFWVL
jgi:hypothetical protein